MRNVIILALAFLVAGAATRFSGTERPTAKPAAAPPSQASTVAVPSDLQGQFRVDATVGGRSIPFLVDTGASIIALTKNDANRLGLKTGRLFDSTVLIQTANGITRGTKVRLASVTVGSLTVHDVTAVVMPDDGRLTENLLGMSFLSRLKRFEFRTGQLVLEQ